ncbi:hypothetical protein ACOSQ2_020999 [Xanthoceras sorbifolium]
MKLVQLYNVSLARLNKDVGFFFGGVDRFGKKKLTQGTVESALLWSGLRGVGKGTNEERKEAEGDRSFNSAIGKFEESCEVLGSVLVTSGGEGKRHSY